MGRDPDPDPDPGAAFEVFEAGGGIKGGGRR